MYDALPEALQKHCEPVGGLYRISMSYDELGEHLDEIGVDWTRELSKRRLKEDKDAIPLDQIAVYGANELIDTKSLSIRNNKKVDAVTIYADIVGFTAHIDAQEKDEDKEQAIRTFHLIRMETRSVIKRDYPGLRIQYQGDRIQAIFHLPKDDAAKVCDTAVRAASAIQSSMEKTLKAELPDAKGLHIAIGVDYDTTLVSSLGERGQRDTICVGNAVENAARYEECLEKKEIGISSEVRKHLSAELQSLFTWSASKKCYVAYELTLDKLEDAEKLTSKAQASSPSPTNRRDIRESPGFA